MPEANTLADMARQVDYTNPRQVENFMVSLAAKVDGIDRHLTDVIKITEQIARRLAQPMTITIGTGPGTDGPQAPPRPSAQPSSTAPAGAVRLPAVHAPSVSPAARVLQPASNASAGPSRLPATSMALTLGSAATSGTPSLSAASNPASRFPNSASVPPSSSIASTSASSTSGAPGIPFIAYRTPPIPPSSPSPTIPAVATSTPTSRSRNLVTPPPITASASTPSSKASAVFNLSTQRALTDQIISFCEPSTVRVLRGVCRELRERMRSELPRHIIIKHYLYIHTPTSTLPLIAFKRETASGEDDAANILKVLPQDVDKVQYNTDNYPFYRPIWDTAVPALKRMAQWIQDSLCRLEVVDFHFIHADDILVFSRTSKTGPEIPVARVPIKIARTWSYPGGSLETWEWSARSLTVDKVIIFYWTPPGVEQPTTDEFLCAGDEPDWLSAKFTANRITLNFDFERDYRFLPSLDTTMWHNVFIDSGARQRYFILHSDSVAPTNAGARNAWRQFLALLLFHAWSRGRDPNTETVLVGFEDFPTQFLPRTSTTWPKGYWMKFKKLGIDQIKFERAESMEEMLASRGTAPGKISMRTMAEHRRMEPTMYDLDTNEEYYVPD